MGVYRANRFRRTAPELARGVAHIWQINEEAASSIATPVSAIICEYIPDDWLQKTVQGIQPLQALIAGQIVISQVLDAEKDLINRYMETQLHRQETVPDLHAQAAAMVEDLPPDATPTAAVGVADLNGEHG